MGAHGRRNFGRIFICLSLRGKGLEDERARKSEIRSVRVGRNKRSALRRMEIDGAGIGRCLGGSSHSGETRGRVRQMGGTARELASDYAALTRSTYCVFGEPFK